MEPCSKEKEIDKIFRVIYGNGETGMKTDLALIKKRVHDMPTATQLKVYAFLGAGFFVSAGYLIEKFFPGG